MRVAVTGGTGFVGRHLARALLSDRHDVVLVARGVDKRDPSSSGPAPHSSRRRRTTPSRFGERSPAVRLC